MKTKKKIQQKPVVEEVVETKDKKNNFLVLHNDEVHTFDYVIQALMDICEHDLEQAEQCTYIVHYKGKCDVKKGPISQLKPLRHKFIEIGLNATID